MKITDTDKVFYSSAIDYLYNKFEIAGEFVKNNGLNSIPLDNISDMMISGLKEWLLSKDGEIWLNSLGYHRSYTLTRSGVAISHLEAICTVCSGVVIKSNGYICEKCGELMCGPCVSVVDKNYSVVWCNKCIEEEKLTSMLVYNE